MQQDHIIVGYPQTGGTLPPLYVAGDIIHFMMENNNSLTATWFIDNLECSIIGEISETEMETMINSIYGE